MFLKTKLTSTIIFYQWCSCKLQTIIKSYTRHAKYVLACVPSWNPQKTTGYTSQASRCHNHNHNHNHCILATETVPSHIHSSHCLRWQRSRGKRPRGQGQGPTPRQSQVLTGWLGRTPEALDTTKGRWTIDRYTDQLHWPHHWHCQPYHQHQPCLVNSIPVFRHCQWAGLAEKLGTFLFYFLQLYCSNGIYPVGNSGCFPWGKPAVTEWASCDSHATQPTVGMLSILVFP